MKILIASDIFGATPALADLVRALGQICLVVSPFDDQQLVFVDEKTAYDAFVKQGGVLPYAEKLRRILQERDAEFSMAIGFSAGASALWIVSANEVAQQLRSCVLFYGSRIREHQALQPLCPVRLIFAEHESAFNATELCREMQLLGHRVELVKGVSHGFMNPHSLGFDAQVQATYLAQLVSD